MAAAPVPADHTTAGLRGAFEKISQTGGWLSAAERVAVAREARAARDCAFCQERKAALSPMSVSGSHRSYAPLAPARIDAIHRIRTDPGRLSRAWYDGVRADGIEPEELVEMTSIIGVMTIADTIARAHSMAEMEIPAPHPNASAPERRPVVGTTLDRGWVPMVDPEAAKGTTEAMYTAVKAGAGFVFNVARALTSVPEALMLFFGAFLPNYSTHGPVRPGGLDRTQVELLAATTSAHNDCFY